MTGDRESQLVELVNTHGEAIGSATVAEAHAEPGLLHRAFSVLLFDQDSRILLQQRAASKTRFPMRWANACCGHPGPGEQVLVAAARRLDEELGIRQVDLTEVGVYTYAAVDAATGRMEREYDHVVIGQVPATVAISADAAEVAQTRWWSVPELTADIASPDYAPWLAGVLRVAKQAHFLSGMS